MEVPQRSIGNTAAVVNKLTRTKHTFRICHIVLSDEVWEQVVVAEIEDTLIGERTVGYYAFDRQDARDFKTPNDLFPVSETEAHERMAAQTGVSQELLPEQAFATIQEVRMYIIAPSSE